MRYCLAIPLLLALGACSPVLTFNSLVPKDAGSTAVARDQAFAPGPRGKMDVYAPRGTTPAAKLPVIVFFYGGSWQAGSKEGYAFAGRALASKGFVVAVPDYRLVPEVRFPAFVEDGAAAVKWVRANAARFGGDPGRIVLAGHSAGAYNAAMLSLDPQWLGQDRSAVKGFVGLAGPYDFLPLDHPSTKAAFGAATDLEATQPANFASADDPPALLMVAGKDNLVGPRNAERLARQLRQAGARAEIRTYRNVGHTGIAAALAKPFRGRAPVLDDLAAFAHAVTGAPRQQPR
jgi:acetyl esterase/lipase